MRPLFLYSEVRQKRWCTCRTNPNGIPIGKCSSDADPTRARTSTNGSLYGHGSAPYTIQDPEWEPDNPYNKVHASVSGYSETFVGRLNYGDRQAFRAIRANWRVFGPTSGFLVQSESVRLAEKESVSPSVGPFCIPMVELVISTSYRGLVRLVYLA